MLSQPHLAVATPSCHRDPIVLSIPAGATLQEDPDVCKGQETVIHVFQSDMMPHMPEHHRQNLVLALASLVVVGGQADPSGGDEQQAQPLRTIAGVATAFGLMLRVVAAVGEVATDVRGSAEDACWAWATSPWRITR